LQLKKKIKEIYNCIFNFILLNHEKRTSKFLVLFFQEDRYFNRKLKYLKAITTVCFAIIKLHVLQVSSE